MARTLHHKIADLEAQLSASRSENKRLRSELVTLQESSQFELKRLRTALEDAWEAVESYKKKYGNAERNALFSGRDVKDYL
jgi:predicted  nucleic acid-binding Zn-ribbon protein